MFKGSARLQTHCATRFIEDAKDDRFFLWLHYMEPHYPYEVHDAHDFGSARRDRYDSEIARADAAIGEVLDTLKAQGVADRTIVIVNSDHGEAFGEHNTRFHGSTLYEEQIRVPLIVHAPGLPARRLRALVGNVDLVPTILDLLDVDHDLPLQGRSLVPLLLGGDDDSDAPMPFAFAELPGAMRGLSPGVAHRDALRLGDLKLVWNPTDAVAELYDLKADPIEERNLATRRPDDVVRLRSVIAALKDECRRINRAATAEDSPPSRSARDPVADARATLATDAPWGEVVAALEALLDAPADASKQLAPQLQPLLAGPPIVARRAAWVLARTGDAAGRAVLEVAYGSGDDLVKLIGAAGLACLGDSRGVEDLRPWLVSLAHRAKTCARWIDALARLRTFAVAPEVVEILANGYRHHSLLVAVIAWLAAVEGEDATGVWIPILSGWDPDVAARAQAACSRRLGADRARRLVAAGADLVDVRDLAEQGKFEDAIAAAERVARACGSDAAGAPWWLQAARLAHRLGDATRRDEYRARVMASRVAAWREAAERLPRVPQTPSDHDALEVVEFGPAGISPFNPTSLVVFRARLENRSSEVIAGGRWGLSPPLTPTWWQGAEAFWESNEPILLPDPGLLPGEETTVYLIGRIPLGRGDVSVRPGVYWPQSGPRRIARATERAHAVHLPADGAVGLDPAEVVFTGADVRAGWIRSPSIIGGELDADGSVVFACPGPGLWLMSPVIEDVGKPVSFELTYRVIVRGDRTPTFRCVSEYGPKPGEGPQRENAAPLPVKPELWKVPARFPTVGGRGVRLIRLLPTDGADLIVIDRIRIFLKS
ncbi:MAG: hypothetical protein CMJ83_15205 [Planctomycetes bacterium]|nr:hypothetical protein [Planctomycetota bacterium]